MMDFEEQRSRELCRWLPLAFFSASSVGIILLNQGIMMEFGEPLVAIMCQNISTVVILQLFTRSSVFNLDLGNAMKWLPCAFLFCLNLISSLMSLLFIRAATFLVLRDLQPILAYLVESATRGHAGWTSDLQFLICILAGAVVYASGDLQYDAMGYSWALMHILSVTMYAIMVRKRQDEMDITVTDMSMYNNVLSIPVLFGSLFFKMPRMSLDGLRPEAWCLLAASCLCAALISISGLAAQRIVTPTSWLALNNLSKIPAIVLSYVLFGGLPTATMAFGMTMSLVSGYFYALSRVDGIAPVHAGAYTLTAVLLSVYVGVCNPTSALRVDDCSVFFPFKWIYSSLLY